MNGSFQLMYSAVSITEIRKKEKRRERERMNFKEFPILSFSMRLCTKWVSVMNGIQFIFAT